MVLSRRRAIEGDKQGHTLRTRVLTDLPRIAPCWLPASNRSTLDCELRREAVPHWCYSACFSGVEQVDACSDKRNFLAGDARKLSETRG